MPKAILSSHLIFCFEITLISFVKLNEVAKIGNEGKSLNISHEVWNIVLKLQLLENDEFELINRANEAIELLTILDVAYSKLAVGLIIFGTDSKVIYGNDLARIYLGLPHLQVGSLVNDILLQLDTCVKNEIQLLFDSFQHANHDRQNAIVTIDGLTLFLKLEMLDRSLRNSYFSLFISSMNIGGDITPDFVVGILGLTKAEAKLTVALVNGTTAMEYSKHNNLSINTVYCQIKAILAKTGVRRQAELVKLVFDLAARPNYTHR